MQTRKQIIQNSFRAWLEAEGREKFPKGLTDSDHNILIALLDEAWDNGAYIYEHHIATLPKVNINGVEYYAKPEEIAKTFGKNF